MKHPGKRTASLGVTLVAAAALSACGAVESTDTAATVNDSRFSVDQLEDVVRTFAEHGDITGLQEDPGTGTVAADAVRGYLTAIVEGELNEQFLAANGESITEEDRQAVLDQLPEDSPVTDFPAGVRDLVVESNAGPAARARVAAPPADELQRRYEAAPSDLGVLCVRHVLLETEAEAQEVVDELAAGASMEELARERSTDPSAADNGGALEITGSACASLLDARGAVDPTFVAAALTSRPGVPVGPVATDFGWHVIEARPYDEVADSLASLFESSAGDLLFAAYLTTADVRIDPRYGRWDAATQSVVAL